MIKSKLFIDSYWNAADYFTTFFIYLLISKLLITKIGIDGYGFYNFFTSLAATFSLIDVGMGVAVSKYLSEFLHNNKNDEANEVITLAVVFYSVLGLLLISGVIFWNQAILDFLNFDNSFITASAVLNITAIIFMVNSLANICLNILVSLEKWVKISASSISFKFFNAIFIVFVLLADFSVSTKIKNIFLGALFLAVLKLITFFVLARHDYSQMMFKKPSLRVRSHVVSFLKISSIQYFFSFFIGHIDKFIINKMFGLEILGTYTFVLQAFVYLYGFLGNIFKIFLPKLSKLHGERDVHMLKKTFKNLLVSSFCLSILLSVVFLVIWRPFIGIYLDSEFALESFSYVVLFAFFLVVKSFEPIFAYFFNSIAKPIVLLLNLLICAFVTISLYFVLIPIYHVYGVIISQIIANLIVYICSFCLIEKIYRGVGLAN